MESAPESTVMHTYAGSRQMMPLSELLGLPIDQVNFIMCQLVAVGIAYPFRACFHPQRATPTTRHIIEISLGIILTLYCYGYQIWLIVAQSLGCLILMRLLKPGLMEKAVFIIALGYLCISHIYRQIYDYGGYTLDITGPLMVNTQRMSSMAYSVADAHAKSDIKMAPATKKQIIRRFPSVLEFVSYIFSFHTAICGPFVFYNDYIAFIEGKDFQPHTSLNVVVVKVLAVASICGCITVFILPNFPISYIADEKYIQGGFIHQTMYVIVCTTVTRNKYYFAWKLAEAANNNAGLGFNGYDEKTGEAKWDLVNNASIRKVEFSLSLKELLDNWNITTTSWLRHVVYIRVPFMHTLAVFLFSAFWHGFYPGYYLTFLTGAIFITASRLIRRNIRPMFQGSERMAFVYDVLTFITTRVGVGYLTFPFVALEFAPCLRIYKMKFFWLHILSILAIIVFSFVKPKPKPKPAVDKKQ